MDLVGDVVEHYKTPAATTPSAAPESSKIRCRGEVTAPTAMTSTEAGGCGGGCSGSVQLQLLLHLHVVLLVQVGGLDMMVVDVSGLYELQPI